MEFEDDWRLLINNKMPMIFFLQIKDHLLNSDCNLSRTSCSIVDDSGTNRLPPLNLQIFCVCRDLHKIIEFV